MTHLLRGRNIDSLMKTEPESKMYQQVPMSSGLKHKEMAMNDVKSPGGLITLLLNHSAAETSNLITSVERSFISFPTAASALSERFRCMVLF